MKPILIFFLIIVTLSGNAQIVYFDNQYDYMQHPESPFDITLVDSSYLIVGGESLNGSVVNNKFYFLKIGDNGNILLQKSIGPGVNKSATLWNILQLGNDALYIQGTRTTYEPEHDTQIFLSRIDEQSLDTLWTKDYGIDTLYESTGEAIHTIDSGVAVAGWVFNENYVTRIHLMKMDSLGNLEFYNHFTSDSTLKHEGHSVVQTEDEGFLILGFRREKIDYEDSQITVTDRLLLKADSLGVQEWMQFYPAETDSLINSNQHNWIIPLEGGNYLSGGHNIHFRETFPYLADFQEYSLTKYDSSGEIIWDKSYRENSGVFWNSGIETSNGNLVLVGYERDYPLVNGRKRYGIIASTDAEGDLLWFRKYYSAPEDVDMDFLKALIEAPDGGYVACGDSFGRWEDSTYQNVWVIKTDSIGCLEPYCDSIFTAVEEPIPATTEKSLNLYPNPTSDQLTVDIGENSTLLGIQIFDSSGKRVEDIQFFRSQHLHSHTLSIRQLPAGLYFVHVRTDKGWRSGKVAKL